MELKSSNSSARKLFRELTNYEMISLFKLNQLIKLNEFNLIIVVKNIMQDCISIDCRIIRFWNSFSHETLVRREILNLIQFKELNQLN